MTSRLKERVYVTFTALAVLLAMNLHSHDPKPGASAVSLLVTVAAILMAGLVADLISHSTVHASLPTRAELRHQLEVAWGAGGAIVGPLILLGLSALGVFSTPTALIWGGSGCSWRRWHSLPGSLCAGVSSASGAPCG